MSEPITLPPSSEIAARIAACRDELKALRKLLRLAQAEEAARTARQRRQQSTSAQGGVPCPA